MKRLIIDQSNILKMCLFSAVKAENAYKDPAGTDTLIASHLDAYERFLSTFTKTLRELYMVPIQVVMVRDGIRGNAQRREISPDYKRKDKQIPEAFFEELLQLRDKVEDTVLNLGGIVCWHEDFEADDMIAALAGVTECIIWSADKDLLSYGDVYSNGGFGEDKFLGIPKRNIRVYKAIVGDPSDNISGVKGIGEGALLKLIEQFGDDALDDLADMLENRTLHELAPYVDDFKPFKKIIAQAEEAYLSWELVKPLHPGWTDINWLARPQAPSKDLPEYSAKVELVERGGLNQAFLDRFKAQAQLTPFGYGFDIETWADEESVEWGWANKGSTDKDPKLDVFGSHLAGFSVTVGVNNQICYYFPVDHADTDNLSMADVERLLNLLADGKGMYVWNAEFELPIMRSHAELRFDRGFLPNVHDAMLMKSYVNENGWLQLKEASRNYLGYQQITYEEVTEGKKMNELTAKHVLKYGADDSVCTVALASLFELIMKYEGTYDAFKMCELSPLYLIAESFLNGQKFDLDRLAELKRENDEEMEKLQVELNSKLMTVSWEVMVDQDTIWTYRMPGCSYEQVHEFNAASIKSVYGQLTKTPLKTRLAMPEKLAVLVEPDIPELADAIRTGTVEALNEIGEELFAPTPKFDPASPKDMEHLLYTAFDFPVRLRGKVTDIMRAKGIRQGNPKVNEAAVQTAIIYDAADSPHKKEILALILKIKALQTNESLYLNPYPKMPNPKDGMVHPQAGMSKTITRRFAPNGPNIAQVSKKSPIREGYIPHDPAYIWWSFDWAGQELRLTAERSQCPAMLACYPVDGEAKDLHTITALKIAELNGVDVSYEDFLGMLDGEGEVRKQAKNYRDAAKAVNFGDIYGQTEVGLANKLLITKETALMILEAKAKAFPGVDQWKKDVRENATEQGYVSTMLGARKHVDLSLFGTWKFEHELRASVNFEIQSAAAEQTKLAMSKLWERRVFERHDAYFHFPVHDEIDGCVRLDERTIDFLEEVHGVMLEQYANMAVPIESSISIGPNFGQLKELGTKFDRDKISAALEELR